MKREVENLKYIVSILAAVLIVFGTYHTGYAAVTPVKDRTPQVRDAIVAGVPGVNNAADVTEAHLAAITGLHLRNKAITSLKMGDFDGLTNLTTLNLDQNSISDISSLSELASLTTLRLGWNSISDISSLSELTSLTYLWLGSNSISDISVLSELTSLTTLYLHGNSISDISSLSELTSLTLLDLGWNNISDISSLSELTSLTALNLGGNNISDISVLSELTSLTWLELDRNNISDISSLSELTSLTTLRLFGNPISNYGPLRKLLAAIVAAGRTLSLDIPVPHVPIADRTPQVRDAILYAMNVTKDDLHLIKNQHLSRVKSLFLSGKSISSLLPHDFDSLTALTNIDLSDNSLTSLPSGIFDRLPNLSSIRLENNSLRSLPSGVFTLPALKSLDLSNNSLSSLRVDTFNTPQLTSLDLSNNSLSSLPVGAFNGLPALTLLRLQNNSLTTLPADVFNELSALEFLYLENNSLRNLPTGAFNGLSALESLYLQDNALTGLPDNIFGELTTLSRLELQSNSLVRLSSEIFGNGLPELGWLDLSDNSLTRLPSDMFTGMSKLWTLSLGENSLTNLPSDVFAEAPELKTLSLHSNALRSLPANLFDRNTKLQILVLYDNNIRELSFLENMTSLRLLSVLKNPITDYGPLHTLIAKINRIAGHPGLKLDITIRITPVTDRTPQIQDAIVEELVGAGIAGIDSAADVTTTHLQMVRALDLEGQQISSLKPEDFDGLSGLQQLGLNNNSFTSLPAEVFNGLSELFYLNLSRNSLSRLPEDVFDGLRALKWLDLSLNSLSRLPVGIFDDLPALTQLNLRRNSLTNLTADVFDGLSLLKLDLRRCKISDVSFLENMTSLRYLYLANNPISDYGPLRRLVAAIEAIPNHPGLTLDITIPAISVSVDVPVAARTPQVRDAIVAAIPGVSAANQVTAAHLAAITNLNLRSAGITALQADDFSGMTALTSLNLFNNQLSRLPDGIFAGLTSLTTIRLGRNVIDPFRLTVSLEKIADGAFKAVAPAGATFNYVLPISVTNGTLNGGATTLVIPHGHLESGTLTVTRTPGTTGHVMVDIAAFPRLPRTHYGYTLVKSDHLPLVAIRGINTAPVFSDGTTATRSVAENTAANINIGTPITATDVDNDTLTYTLSGTDAAAFGIDSTTGQLRTQAALDYETKAAYSITVTVSDGYGGSDSISVTINITDVIENRAPVFTEGSSTTRTIAENTAANTNISTAITATDADNDRLTYTLSGTDASSFAIDRTTGQLSTQAALDYETKRSYTVTVTVSDGRLTDTINVTINITDVAENRAPVFADGTSTTRTIAENTAANTNIGTAVTATDADNDRLTYTLSGTDAAAFGIVITTGQLITNAALDYETKATYSVTVSVSDGNGGSDSITVTINVTDINEVPVTAVDDAPTTNEAPATNADEEAVPTGICKVGDVLAPGESCTYPDTDAVFSVLDDGSSQWNIPNFPWLDKVSLGGAISFTADINNKNYHFVAKAVANKAWEIEEIGDDSTQPPDPPEPPENTGGQDPDPPETPRDRGTSEPPINTGGTPTLTASTTAPLTEATLNGSVVTLTLSEGTYQRSRWDIEDAVSVSDISGVTFDSFFDLDRVSDTKVTVELEFSGNINTDSTLTLTVGADAIADYNGAALTAQIPVTAVSESIVASTAAPLTEATLDESVVTLTLSGRKYARSWDIRDAVTVSGISGVTVRSFDIDRESDTEVTVELTFNGNMNSDGTLTFTVGPNAIAGYNGTALTAQVTVSASTDAPADTGDQNPDPPETPQQPGNQDTPQQPDNTGGTPTLTASTTAPLTEATLNEGIVTLTLSGGTYQRSRIEIGNAVSVSGIAGVTIGTFGPAWFGVKRVSDTEITVELGFDGSFDTGSTLTLTIGADAIADYNGPALTARISVSASTDAPADTGGQNPDPPDPPETPRDRGTPASPINTGDTPTLTASTTSALTEATLHGSVVTLTLNGGTYERARWDIEDAVSMSGISGVTFDSFFDLDRVSDTKVTIELEFSGNIDTNGTLTFTVGADAIAGYNGTALTAQVTVTAAAESVAASSTSPLKEATLDGSVVTLTLSGRKFESFIFDIRDAVSVSGIAGVTIPWHQPDKKSDTEITVELEFDGNMNTDGTLTFTIGADAIAGYKGPALTAQIAVTADRENALLANFPNPFNPETWIPYQLEKPTDVSISIYAIDGKLVRTLDLGHQPAGIYRNRSRAAYWDGRNRYGEPVASGVYFYTLTAGDFSATRKMLIRK